MCPWSSLPSQDASNMCNSCGRVAQARGGRESTGMLSRMCNVDLTILVHTCQQCHTLTGASKSLQIKNPLQLQTSVPKQAELQYIQETLHLT